VSSSQSAHVANYSLIHMYLQLHVQGTHIFSTANTGSFSLKSKHSCIKETSPPTNMPHLPAHNTVLSHITQKTKYLNNMTQVVRYINRQIHVTHNCLHFTLPETRPARLTFRPTPTPLIRGKTFTHTYTINAPHTKSMEPFCCESLIPVSTFTHTSHVPLIFLRRNSYVPFDEAR
jgi:hypothetical protein